jgi:hypothetical protein
MDMVSDPSMIGQGSDPAEPRLPEKGSVDAPSTVPDAAPAPPPLDPTRYGDWEKNGRCIDF